MSKLLTEYEDLKAYVKARVKEVKRYREVAEATGLDQNWLMKISQDLIENPGIEKLLIAAEHYRKLERKRPNGEARPS